jgi:hypothetical protein
LQNATRSLRLRTFSPFLAEVSYDFSPSGFALLNVDQRFAPMVPFHLEFSSTPSLCVGLRLPPPGFLSQVSSMISLKTVQLGGYLDKLGLTGVASLEFADRFSASVSLRPLCFGLTYAGNRAGAEFVYNSFQEQPGFSGLFHWEERNTEVSILASMYGAVTALTTTKFGIATVSSHLETNFFTLASTAAHGLTVHYREFTLSLSVSFPSRRVSWEVEIEGEPVSGVKAGLGLFLPGWGRQA